MSEEPGTPNQAGEEQTLIDPENKEKLSTAKLEVHINKQKLLTLKDPNLGLIPRLQEMVDTLARLPENLNFQPGVTLVVGDNGSGKSTLGRAIYFKILEQGWRKKLTERNKDDVRASWDRKSTPEEIEQNVYAHTFDPRLKNHGEIFELKRAGLAPYISQVLSVDADFATSDDYAGIPLRSGINTEYEEFATSLAGANEGSMRFVAGESFDTGHLTEERVNTGSHRQRLNKVFDRLNTEKEGNPDKPKIYFLDEPETGLSPRRHLGIQEQLERVIIHGSVALVPTNSTVLYESDLPRIDLDFPERGIFRPSQYPQDQQ